MVEDRFDRLVYHDMGLRGLRDGQFDHPRGDRRGLCGICLRCGHQEQPHPGAREDGSDVHAHADLDRLADDTGSRRNWVADDTYDDVNDNGRKDCADVVLCFNQMSWVVANEPLAAFDYNGNGRIDFADTIWLFNNL
ncbi:MAG: dockerin type I domain-containing protein [Methanospirillum sp.]